jgi:serine/threonine-protein kinase HipA
MQSLCAPRSFDFNNAGAYAYEQAFLVLRQLHLPWAAVEEQFREWCLSSLPATRIDVKNIAFLMGFYGALGPRAGLRRDLSSYNLAVTGLPGIR